MSHAPPCVYCRRRAAEPDWAPFCSERCRMADLGQWLSGGYRVPDSPAAGPQHDEHAPGGEGPSGHPDDDR